MLQKIESKKSKAKPPVSVDKNLIARSAEGYPLIGYCVYWSMSDTSLKFTEFAQMLLDAGIDPEMARAPRDKSALIRALHEEAKGRSNSFHRKVLDKGDTAAFAIVATSVDSQAVDVNFSTDTKVLFDKKSGFVKVEGFNGQQITDKYLEFKNIYTTDNIRTVVLRYLYSDCDAIAIRDRGGVYFVPATKLEAFQKLQALFEKFPSFSLDLVPVIDTAQAKKSMWRALVGEVESELATLKAELAKKKDKGEEYSERGVESKLKHFQRLKEKVGDYEDLLTGTAMNLKNELDEVSKALREMLK